MGYQYHNANPLGRRVNDCTVRAISLATNLSWDEAYDWLSSYAKSQAIMMDEVEYIDKFLDDNFTKILTNQFDAVDEMSNISINYD